MTAIRGSFNLSGPFRCCGEPIPVDLVEDRGSYFDVSNAGIQQDSSDVTEQPNRVIRNRRVGPVYLIQIEARLPINCGDGHVEEVEHLVGEPHQFINDRRDQNRVTAGFFEPGYPLWGHPPA